MSGLKRQWAAVTTYRSLIKFPTQSLSESPITSRPTTQGYLFAGCTSWPPTTRRSLMMPHLQTAGGMVVVVVVVTAGVVVVAEGGAMVEAGVVVAEGEGTGGLVGGGVGFGLSG